MLKMCDNKSSDIAEGGSALFRTGNDNLSPNACFEQMNMEATKYVSCCVGRTKKSDCHQTCHVKETGIKFVHQLPVEQQELLLLRTELLREELKTICLHHENFYLEKYECYQISCCDPFKSHIKPVKKSLRKVTITYVQSSVPSAIRLIPGQKICASCRRRIDALKIGKEEVVSHESDEEDLIRLESQASKESNIEELNTTLTQLGQSPLKLHSMAKHSKETYGKRKIDNFSEAFATKVSRALDVNLHSLPHSSQEMDNLKKAEDFDKMVELMKQKIATVNRQRKIQILTMVPPSWSREKAADEFGVSVYMIWQARRLAMEKGICELPNPCKGKKLANDVCVVIEDFYQDDEFSRSMPGAKDKVSICKNTYKQKRLVLCNLKELYCCFKKRYPDVKVGFSKFCTLRPKWCVLAGSSGTHSVCVCTIHQNVELLITALGIDETFSNLISLCATTRMLCACYVSVTIALLMKTYEIILSVS